MNIYFFENFFDETKNINKTNKKPKNKMKTHKSERARSQRKCTLANRWDRQDGWEKQAHYI